MLDWDVHVDVDGPAQLCQLVRRACDLGLHVLLRAPDQLAGLVNQAEVDINGRSLVEKRQQVAGADALSRPQAAVAADHRCAAAHRPGVAELRDVCELVMPEPLVRVYVVDARSNPADGLSYTDTLHQRAVP